MVLEAVGPAHVAANGIDGAMPGHVHQLEQVRPMLGSRGAEAGAE